MNKKIRLVSTLALQFVAGTEVDAIVKNGKVYVEAFPAVGNSVAAEDDEEETPAPVKSAPVKAATKATAEKAVVSTNTAYTEDELMAMDVKELEKLCIKMGIDPDEHDGRNTNKKLRLLILDKQEESAAAPAEEPAPVKGGRGATAKTEPSGYNKKTVSAIFSSLDSNDNKYTLESAIEAIAEMGAPEKTVRKIMEEFMASPNEPIATFEDEIANLFANASAPAARGGRGAAAPAPAPAKKASKKEPVAVNEEDLEVGDRVSIYWEDNEAYFEGEVIKVDRKGVTVRYDEDNSELLIEAENNTEILRY